MSMQSFKTQELHPEGELGTDKKEALGYWRDQDPKEEGPAPVRP